MFASRGIGLLLAAAAWTGAGHAAQDAPAAHALIIGIGQYASESRAGPLKGIPHDVEMARKMAAALGAPSGSIVELRDGAATKENILHALQTLREQVQPGDRVMLYFSGHGTRMETEDGCREGFSTYTGDMLSDEELAKYTAPISERADKLFVMLDACFSGGVIRTRSLLDGGMRAKFSEGASSCVPPVNQRTRSLLSEVKRLGIREENFVQISSANYNEVSWDNEAFGGVATRSVSECLLGDAIDLNRSGAVSLEEVRACAQNKMDALMSPFTSAGMIGSTLQVRGNRNLVVAPAAPVADAAPPAAPVVVPVVVAPVPVAVTPVAVTPVVSPPPLQGPEATLDDIYQQRDPRRVVEVQAPRSLKIGRDPFAFSVRSSHDGYLYALMLGSDRKSFYLLFPNKLDGDNRVLANREYSFPGRRWRAMASGPAGTDRILFVVSQSPRAADAMAGGASGGGDFTYAPTDIASRRRLVDAIVGRGVRGRSVAMGAAIIDLEEAQ